MMSNPKGQNYRGRFAPSPSGPLHFGSLIAAVASFLQARKHSGEWLVRMEDLDPPREMPGADSLILKSLETHGLCWDGEVMYQSQRHEAYESALNTLANKDLVFYCSCSNKSIREFNTGTKDHQGLLRDGIYPGLCRSQKSIKPDCSIRILVDNQVILFKDKTYGLIAQDLQSDVGDFVLKRRDGLYAYQLAVVVDDIEQKISEIVRGVDLLDSTARQIYLYQQLDAVPPDYLHIPLALLPNHKKLSKQTGAPALDDSLAVDNLVAVLDFLGQHPPTGLSTESVETVLKWAEGKWDSSKISVQDIVI